MSGAGELVCQCIRLPDVKKSDHCDNDNYDDADE